MNTEIENLKAEKERLMSLIGFALDSGVSEIKRLKDDNRMLLEALERYGCHEQHCEYDGSKYPHTCTCGLEDAIRSAAKELK